MSNDIKKDLINWNAEQLSDDSPVYNSKDLINALNSIMPSLGSVILTTNNHVLSKQEDWDNITMNTLNMFTTLANSGLPANDFPNNSGILLVLGYTSYNIYIAISGEAVYYRLGGDDWNKLLTSETIKDLTGSVATLMDTISKLSDQQTTLSSLFNTFKEDTNKQLDTLNTESTSQAKMLEDINNQLVELNGDYNTVKNAVKEAQDDYNQMAREAKAQISMSTTITGSDNTPFETALQRAKNNNMNFTLVDMVNITSATDSNPVPMDDADINKYIKEIHDINRNIVMLKPHLGVNWSDGFSRAKYLPDDHDKFFSNWKVILLNHAKLCVDNDIPVLSLGCEQVDQFNDKYYDNWVDIVSAIRKAYPSLKLTIASNSWGDIFSRKIFDLLDYIGVNWYPAYDYTHYDSEDEMEYSVADVQTMLSGGGAMNQPQISPKSEFDILRDLVHTKNKPLWITEIGVCNKLGGLQKLLPSDYADRTHEYFKPVAIAMRTAIPTLATMTEVEGISWWHTSDPFNYAHYGSDTQSVAEIEWNKEVEKYGR